MELFLTTEEERLLVRILEDRHRDLLHEINKTDHHEFREILRRREELIAHLLEKLGVAQTV